MEIYLSQIKKVKNIIEDLYLDKKGESMSAHKCIMINQEEEDLTTFSSYEPDSLYHKRYLKNNDNEKGYKGLSFLADHQSLRLICSAILQANYKSISLRTKKGYLIISSDEEYVNQELIAKNVDSCPTYIGQRDDFSPPQELTSEDYIGNINEYSFKELFNPIIDFGSTEENSRESFLFQGISNNLVCMSHHKSNFGGYILSSREGEIHNFSPLFIQRRFIPKIILTCGNSKSDFVNIYIKDDWIQFKGNQGTILIKGSPSQRQFFQAQNMIVHQSNHKLISKRVFSVSNLLQPFEYYQIRAKDSSKSLLTQSVDDKIRILLPDQQSDTFTASVECDLEFSEGEFKSVLVVNSITKALIESLKKEAVKKEKEVKIEITQRELEKDKHSCLMYFRIYDEKYNNQIGGFIRANVAEESLDELEAND